MSNLNLKIKWFSLQLVLMIFLVGLTNTVIAQISLNEICAINDNVFVDDFNDTPDWIELHNHSDETVDMKGWYLTDDASNLQKWPISNISIAAGEFQLIMADDEEIIFQYPHANFKLSSAGEQVLLIDPLGNIVDEITFPELSADTSFGRTSNGLSDWIVMSVPTPLRSNLETPFDGISIAPNCLNLERYHLESVNIVLECPEVDCQIYYSLDGTSPNKSFSILYDGEFELTETAVVRAIAYTPDKLPSAVKSFSFFINENHSLPIIHLTTRPDNFWDWDNGILVRGPDAEEEWPYFGANYWKDITVPVFVEYYDKNNTLAFSHQMDSKIHGGRGARPHSQKPLRLLAKNRYGSEYVDFKFFEDRDRETYKRIVLRNASGDHNNCHFRDAFLARYFIAEDLNVDVLAYQPVVIYLNGEYYGVTNMREKSDEFYLKNNYNVDIDNLDLLEEDTLVVVGDFEIWNEMYDFVVNSDMSVESNYEIATTYFDIENLADSYIVQTGLNNNDWLGNNIKYWREKVPGAKWRYITFDMDIALSRHNWTLFNLDLFREKIESTNNIHIDILLSLLENQGFREFFISRYADLFNTSFRAEIFQEELERTVQLIEPEMNRHFQRWPTRTFDSWRFDKVPTVDLHMQERPAYARQFLIDYFELEKEVEIKINTYPEGAGKIIVNTITPDELPWTGHYFDGVPVTLTIEPNPGFTFSHWRSYHTITEKDFSQQISYNFSSDDEIIAYFEDDEEKFDLNEVFVSPDGLLNINFVSGQPQAFKFFMYDQLGRSVYSIPDVQVGGGNQQLQLQLPTLPSGIYYVSIFYEDEEIALKIPIFN